MNTETHELPENIQAAITDYEVKKQAFIVEREKYSTVLTRLDKHKKTAQAARNESEQSSQTWRELLRETDGALTKDINALRRQEADAKDLAQEFDNLITEVEKTASVSELAAWDAWCEYRTARSVLTNLQDAYEFEQAKAVLLAMPEAKMIARAMKIIARNYRDPLAEFRTDNYDAGVPHANSILAKMFSDLLKDDDGSKYLFDALPSESCHPIDADKLNRISGIKMREIRKELGVFAS